jgi:transcriptional regulator with XRE-family HTH domain
VSIGQLKQKTWHTALGSAIRRLRQTRGLSQEAMALALGMSRSHASKLETGVISPTFDTLLAIMDLLEMRPDVFMREVQKEHSAKPASRR